MCRLAAVRFNMAGSGCSHRWRVFFLCVNPDKKVHLHTTLQIFSSLFQHFEKRKTQMESICEKKREAKSKKDE